jgi:dolichol-phosphate mannosyltransferase
MAVVDVLLFNAGILAGIQLVSAHILSFAVASLLVYWVRLRPALLAGGRGGWAHAWLLVASLMALFLRGGVLGLLNARWGWPAQVAIVPAALAGAAVCLMASSLVSPALQSRNEIIQRLAIVVVAYVFLLHLIYIGQVELLPEEAYYWSYWQHPDIGYLDHPPMVAWLIGLGTSLFGSTEFGVRAGALLSQGIASFFAYRLTRNLFGQPSALVALVLMQVLPFFFLTGMLMTPEAPLLAAWAACLYFLERALLAGRSQAWWGVGVCLGLGLVSKYTIGLLGPATLLFALLDPKARRWLWSWQPYAAAAVALLIFSPVIIWNAQHEWASFVFQTSRRLADPTQFALHKLIVSVLVLITPTGLASLPIILSRPAPSPQEGEEPRRALRFTQVFVLVPLAVFVAFSLRHDVKLDWTGALWLAAVPALASFIAEARGEGGGARARIRAAWIPTGMAVLPLLAAALHHLVLALPGVGLSEHLELVPVGWRQLGREISQLAASMPRDSNSRPLVVGMDRYTLASELSFYAPDRAVSVANTASVHLFGDVGLMYERWFPIDGQRGRTLLLVAWKAEELRTERLEPLVTSLQPIESVALVREGKLIRRVYYRIAHGYRPPSIETKPPAG